VVELKEANKLWKKTDFGEWYVNLPFKDIPKSLVESLLGGDASYDRYLHYCNYLDAIPNVWNLCLVNDNNEVTIAIYGIVDPLISDVIGLRVSASPELFSYDGTILRECCSAMKFLAEWLNIEHTYFTCDKVGVFMRKIPDVCKLTGTQVMEVI